MSKLEIAARLALVSLEHAPQKSIKQRQAITALKEALDPEKQEPTQDEPVDISDTLDADAFFDLRLPMDIRIGCGVNKAGTTIRALLLRLNALPQIGTKQDDEPTKAEAAAYLYDLDAYCDHRPEQDILAKTLPRLTLEKYVKNIRPLYLHPAPRPEFVRLSEDEVTEILTSAYDMYAAICAVENRLVEKNRG